MRIPILRMLPSMKTYLSTLFLIVLLSRLAEAQANPSALDHLRTGQADLAAGHAIEAESEFRAALEIDHGNANAQAGLGVAEEMRGDCGPARQDLRKALSLQPSLIDAEGLLGVCEKRMGDPEAEAHLEAAFAHIPSAPSRTSQLRLQVGVELGDLYYQRGNLDKALPIVRELVASYPENIDILFFAQHLYQQMADETMNKLALLAPASARMQQVIAEHLVNTGDLAGAAEHYHQAIALDAALPGAHFELAEAIVEAAPRDASAQNQGLQELKTALRIDGENAHLECALGRVALLQNQPEPALAHYERAYALNPLEVEAQMGISRILLDQGKPEKALRYLAEAVDQDPLNAEAHYHYARALKSLHRDTEAQEQTKLFETVRRAQNQVKELYRQMNKRVHADTAEPPASEGSQP